MAALFGRDVKTIGKHINNALREELNDSTVAKFATVQNEGNRSVERDIEYYNLDMIIAVGYKVKSKRGVETSLDAKQVLSVIFIKAFLMAGLPKEKGHAEIFSSVANDLARYI